MTSPHRLDYGSVTIDRPVVDDPSTCVVTVQARCVCGYELSGAGDCFVEADHLLQRALAQHLETVSREQDRPDAPESGQH